MYPNKQLLHMETTCGSLLSELQKIWGEVGEPESEKDKMLLELEQECLEAYRRKVDHANQCRAHLRKAVADSEAELAFMCSAMAERPLHKSQTARNLKEELEVIIPTLEEMRKRKIERSRQFIEVLDQIKNISKEIYRSMEDSRCTVVVDESDLSLKRLEELHIQLLAFQKEKSDRLKQVLDHLNTLNSLCIVLGVDFKITIKEIHPSLDDSIGTKNVSIETMERLSTAIQRLRQIKIERVRQLQDLATTMVELWSLMDTPIEEQLMFQNVTKNIAISENEITEPNALSVDFINYAEAEVLRLRQMKSSKMKEVIMKKRSNLEELCRKAHMVTEAQGAVDYSVEAIESGLIDLSIVLEHIELQISKVKEEAFSRKDILEKVEKWMDACEEECWLEEYNQDDNRYNAGRGTHLVLKRAEKARVVVNKIPAMVDTLTSKAAAWEKERGVEFSYDGVRLLSMLEKYSFLKQEKEQERLRQRDQKRLQGQLLAEQEVLFGSKPSPSKSGSKVSRTSSIGGASSRRMSLGGAMLQASLPEKTAFPSRKSNSVKQHNSCSVDPSSGKKILDIDGLKVNQHTRKPLSPVNSFLISRNNSAKLQDQNLSSPAKVISNVNEDVNRTPRTMPVPLPNTPPTVSVAMQTTTTPATPRVMCGAEDVEYSFEERRASVVLPKSYLRSLLHL